MQKLKAILSTVLIFNQLYANDTIELTLDSAISYALKNNHQSKISKLALDVANAQYKQALSANYPSLDLDITASRKDEPSNFRMNGDITLSESVSKDLAYVKGMRENAGSTAAGSAYAAGVTGSSTLPLDTNVKVLGRDTVYGTLRLTYPIYTGGKISAIIEQARINKTIKKQDIKLQDDEIIYNVKKIYLSYILTNKIFNSTQKSLLQMQMVKKLTKQLFESESLNVKKTDFLKTNLTVTMIKAQLEKIKANKELTLSALKNILALPYDKNIKILEEDFSYDLANSSLSESNLYSLASLSNPMLNKIKLAMDVSKEKIKESKSNYLPTVALFADTSEFYNSMDGGLNTDDNNNSWSVGINAKINIFNGFKNENEVLEQRLERKKLQSQDSLLKDAILFKLRKALIENKRSFQNIEDYKKANDEAIEHRVLNIKAYRVDLVETKEVIEAQIMELRIQAMYYQSIYDYLLSLAKLSKIVGKKI